MKGASWSVNKRGDSARPFREITGNTWVIKSKTLEEWLCYPERGNPVSKPICETTLKFSTKSIARDYLNKLPESFKKYFKVVSL